MTKDERVAYYKELNQKVIPGQIVCAGSSLMELFPVEKFIQEAEMDVTLYNRGICGYVTEELLEHIDTCILDLQPARLFVNIGTNDLSNPGETIEQMIANYDRILSIVQEKFPQVELYMMAYYPINYEAASEELKPCLRVRTNERISEANEAVKVLAQKHHARYIDLNAPLKDANGSLKAEYTTEGMHITEDGYRSIFPEFMKYATEPKWV